MLRAVGFRCAAVLLLLVGCGTGSETSRPRSDLLVQPGTYRGGDGEFQPLLDGGEAPLSLAPQGGQVLYVGARVEGLVGDEAELSAQLYDPESGLVLGGDARTATFLPVPGASGVSEPDPHGRGHVLHLVLCPNWGPRAAVGEHWRLDLRVEQPGGAGFAKIDIVPVCAPGADQLRALCECECAANYAVGACGAPG